MKAVEIEGLRKTFKGAMGRKRFVAVKEVSLEIEEGEVYGLIGPNGSGKSTTMKALLGLLVPDAGRCAIFGNDSLRVDSRSEVGFLPENPYFYKHLSGAETLRFYGRLCGLRGKQLSQRVEEMLSLTGLEEAAGRRLGGYSKGMLQRIGLAQAMIQGPRLLVLDEPTAGVDPVGSRQIRDLILELKARGITVFLCSHLLEQVQEVCDRVGIIFEGVMLQDGRLDELLEIGDQSEVIIEGASPELLAKVRQLINNDDKARLLSVDRPKRSLERLFLEQTVKDRVDD